MNNKWSNELLTSYPEEFTKLNEATYIQRKNVSTIIDADGIVSGYRCDSRKITVEEYNEIMEKRDEIKKVVLETTNTAQYEDGYNAAKILLGGE